MIEKSNNVTIHFWLNNVKADVETNSTTHLRTTILDNATLDFEMISF